MREKLLITKSDQLPIFLQKYVPKCSRFVRTIDNKFVNASEEKLQQFTNHLILSFYFEHGDVERVDEDLDSLLNENKIKNKGSKTRYLMRLYLIVEACELIEIICAFNINGKI